jgi:hypothetical protein
MPSHNRKRGTGTLKRSGTKWVAIAPRIGGIKKPMRIGACDTERDASRLLDEWLKTQGRIVRRD